MHRTDRLVVGALGLTAGITGVLSYAGLEKFARYSHESIPELWPFALDVPAAALSLAVWRAHSQGRSAIGGRIAIGALVFLSAALQVATADTTAIPDGRSAPLPPLAIYVGLALPACVFAVLWETLLWLRRMPVDVTDPETASDQQVVDGDDADSHTVVYDARRDTAPAAKPVEQRQTQPAGPVLAPRPTAVVVSAPAAVTASHPPLRPDRAPSPPTRKRKGKAASRGTQAAVDTVRAMLEEGEDITALTLSERMGQDPRSGARHLAKPEVQAILRLGISETDEPAADHRLNVLDNDDTLARTGTQRGSERAEPRCLRPTVLSPLRFLWCLTPPLGGCRLVPGESSWQTIP
jgi:hypothetical protein